MKRKLALIVCVIALFAMIFTLASCGGDGNDDHTHTYAQTWSSSEAGHWYAATCGCEGEVSNYGAHVDANKDGKCDTCAYVTCTHTYKSEWSSDAENHWKDSSCGCNVKESLGAHADTNKDGKCDSCAYVMCTHTYADTYSSDATNHWFAPTCGCETANKGVEKHVDAILDGVCDKCGYVMCAHTDKIGGVNDGKNGVCDDCGYVLCEHKYAKTWSSDATNHWYAPTCGCDIANKSVAAHTVVVGDTDAKCSVCSYVICAEHTYADEKTSNETHHWYKSTCGCDVIKGKEEHVWANIWSSDDKNHWRETTCGCEAPNKDTAAHIDEKGNTFDDGKDGVCDVCKVVVCAHVDEKGGVNGGANGICDNTNCEATLCTHTYSNTWSSDETNHYYAPSCGCDLENKNVQKHTDDILDGKCDTCGYVVCEHPDNKGGVNGGKDGICDECGYVVCTHKYDTTWSSDETNHFYAPSCGCDVENKNVQAHVDEIGNEFDNKQDGYCDVCNYQVCDHVDEKGGVKDGANGICDNCEATLCTHTYSNTWSSDENGHFYAPSCGCDVENKNVQAHVDEIGNVFDNKQDGYCDICNYQVCAHVDEKGGVKDGANGICDNCEATLCTHTYSNTWSSDENGHFYAPSCGCDVENKNVQAHVDAEGGVNGGKDGLCDVCEYVLCAHVYASEWSTNDTHHWYEVMCGCDVADKDYGAHAPNVTDTNSACVCGYIFCERHTFETEFSSDGTHHWVATTCGCDYKANYTEHNDAKGGVNNGKDGICDTCKYVLCEHEYADEFSTNGIAHWYETTCGCDVVSNYGYHYNTNEQWSSNAQEHWYVCDACEEAYDKSAHVDLNKDGNCDDCEFAICTHTFVNIWSSNEVAHWYDVTCGCYVSMNKEEHVDEDADGACDTCTFKSAIKETIDSIDDTASENTNSTVADVTTTVNGEETKSEISYKVYDNYIVEFDSYGNQNYYSYYGENGDLLFVIQVSEYGINRNEYATEPESVAYYTMANYSVSASNNEERIKNIYEFAKSQYGFVSSYDATTKTYSMSFAYTDFMYIGNDEYNVVTVANATFVIDEATNGIASANLAFVSYNAQDVEINPGADTYEVAEGAEAVYSEVYAITQTFGAPMDSTSNPNPYPASDYIVTDFTLTDGTNVYEDGDEIELDAMDELVLNFNSEIADKIKFNIVNATATTSDGTELSNWSSQGTIEVDTWADPIAVKFVGKQADTVTIVVDVEGTTLTLTAKVNYLTPDSIDSVVYDEDDYKVTTSEYTIYRGQALKITSSVAAGCNPAFTATLPQGAAAALVDNGDGTYTFTPVMAGDFEITLTSTVATGVSTVLKITAIDPPAISDVLNGTHTGADMYSGLTVGATFTPSEEDALNGTVVVTVNGEAFSYETWEWETIEYSATYTYVYNDGTIELTYVEGDEFEVELLVKNYKVVAVYDFTEYKLVQEDQEPDVPVVGEPTTSPFEVTITDTYMFEDSVIFVAGEAGEYTFYVTKGELGLAIDETIVIDYQGELPDEDGEHTIYLNAGEQIELFFASTVKGTYYVIFTYEEAEAPDEPIVEGGLAGNYTATDNWGNSFDVVITDTTISFTPPRNPEIVWTYEIDGGIVTLYIDGTAITNPLSGAATIDTVNNVFATMSYNGTDYTLAKKSTGTDEPEEEGIEGTYTGTNMMFGTTIDVVISADTIEITFVNPMTGMPMTDYYEYTIVDGVVVITQAGVAVDPMQAEIVLEDGVAVGITYNGTGYTLTVGGGTDEPDPDEPTTGTEENPIAWDEIPENVTINSDTNNKTYFTFTATQSGTLTITYPTADSWADLYEWANDQWNGQTSQGSNMQDVAVFTIEAGKTYRLGIGTFNVAGEFTLPISFVEGEIGGEEEPENVLVIGENTVTITEENASEGGLMFTFTTFYAGQYTFASNDVGARIFDGETMIGMGIVELEANKTYNVFVLAAEAGTYALEILFEEIDSGDDNDEPTEGTMDNPIVWDEIPSEVTFVSNTMDYTYYKFVATESGALIITFPDGESYTTLYAIVDGEIDYEASQSSNMKNRAQFAIEEGKTYLLGIATYWTEGEFTVPLEIGEITADGSQDYPFVGEFGTDYVASFQGGYTGIYYTFTLTENGYVTVSSTYAGTPWLQIGTDVNNLTNNIVGTDPETYENVYANSVSLYAFAGQTVYVAVGDFTFEAGEVPFTVSFEAFESESSAHLAGTWNGAVLDNWGGSVNYVIVINEDGTGTVTEDYVWGTSEYTISFILVNGTSVTINYDDEYGNAYSFALTYDAEANTLSNTSGATFTKA